MVSKMAIFLDASVFYGYANADDIHHKEAKKIMEDVAGNKFGKSVTTDYIFDESVTVALRKASKNTATLLGNFILNSEILLAKVNKFVFHKAWEIFKYTEGLSFTDCTSVAFMHMFGIEYIATFDKGFKNIKGIKVVDK